MSTSFAVMGIAYLGMGVAPSVIVVGAFSLLGGIGNGIEGYATITAIQEQTADAFQTRVAGLVESINAATTGVGFLLGGYWPRWCRRERSTSSRRWPSSPASPRWSPRGLSRPPRPAASPGPEPTASSPKICADVRSGLATKPGLLG
jgi:MFS family permease